MDSADAVLPLAPDGWEYGRDLRGVWWGRRTYPMRHPALDAGDGLLRGRWLPLGLLTRDLVRLGAGPS